MKYKYNYLVSFIGSEDDPAYKAIIPAFNNAIVFGDSLEELEDGVAFGIETEIECLEKEGRPIPVPEEDAEVSGKISLRVDPVIHKKVMLEAKANRMSLNKYIESKLV